MEKKYELIETYCKGYYRIRALKDFQLITGQTVKKGNLGGRIHGEHNLSQEGNCWIHLNATAYQNSRIKDNAVMKDRSMAFDNSTICGNTVLKDWSEVHGNSTISENAVLQAYQHIQFGTVTTDLLGTKDWIGALYAELGIVPNDNKIVLYKRVWSTKDQDVFESDYNRNFLYKIGETVVAEDVNEDIFKPCTGGLHFTSLEFINKRKGNAILECEVEVSDIVTVQYDEVRTRKCRVVGIYKEE